MPTNKIKRYYLYVLQLEQNKYYVGVTSKDPNERFNEHKIGFYGAEWTKIYKPLKIDQSIDLGLTSYAKAEEYENKVTRKYIEKYGIENVRGGNLTYRGKYVKRFGYYYTDASWETIVGMTLMTILMIIFGTYTIFDLMYDR